MEHETIHIPGVVLVTPDRHWDERGLFCELYNAHQTANIEIPPMDVKQLNVSRSKKNVLRGLHFQRLRPQAKLVTVLAGSVFDVVVDLRKDSPAFGSYACFPLSAENGKTLFIPAGCAHGFLSLADNTLFCYLCDDTYSGPEDQSGVRWNDCTLDIPWPVRNPIVSSKDQQLLSFRELHPADLPFTVSR
ncbi:MAG: dTDP-4-dehydrorhamnose 3,5-epimerase [Candidatus Yanofskybacteria bacterium]|nr:dTDP-4-dehydrorhamnose 3,5-epimerase [Candidatus Yanofskybacteria bacterium]